VPDTVPVNSHTDVGKTPTVVFGGIVNGTVRDPMENCTAGSSLGMMLFEVNVIVSEPERTFACGADKDNPIGSCWAGFEVLGKFTKDSEPVAAAPMKIVKTPVAVKLELSAACTLKVNKPMRLGVPRIIPADVSVNPLGSPPFV
jgi:hypothetical protein